MESIALPPLLAQALAFADSIKYVLVFLGALIEGPIVMIASGFLLHRNAFSFAPLFIALIAGDLAGDIGWYYIGYFFAEPVIRKHGHLLGISFENFEKAKALFRRHHERLLIVSKITMGFGMALATLMAAGASHVRFRAYILINALCEPIFAGILLLFGYSFGRLYGYVANGFKIAFMAVSAALILVVLYAFSKYVKNRVKTG